MRAGTTWLDRFGERRVIRQRGVIEHVACRDLETGERRLVIATVDPAAGKILDELARLHGELRHPRIPTLDRRGTAAGTEFVALRSSALADIETLLPIAMGAGGLSPAACTAFLYQVIDAIRTAHATLDPRTRAPICIGAFSAVNIAVTESHRLDVFGWGFPTSETERRVILRDPTLVHVAWEASFGAPATPMSDLDAVGRFFHALLPATAMPPKLVAALRGDVGERETAELVRLIGCLEHAAHAREPSQRSWDDYLDTLRRLIEMLDAPPDDAALERDLAAVCARWRGAMHPSIASDGSWFTDRAGTRVELDRRPNLRSIVAALVAHRRDAPDEPLAAEALLAAGWPGERLARDSGRNRVRVAVSTLRTMGLRELIVTRDDGYLLDPTIAIRIE
jgi:hypothetical protein